MKVNYYGDVFKLNQIEEGLWISDATDHDECLVFESYKNVWYRGIYTTDECEQLIEDRKEYAAKEVELYDLDEIELTDETIDLILANTDEMLNVLADEYGIITEGK